MDSDDGRNSACRAAAGPPAQGFPIPPPLKKTVRHPAGSSPVALSPVARELPFARRRKAKSEEREGGVCQAEVRDGRGFCERVPRRACRFHPRPKHGCHLGLLPFGPMEGQARPRASNRRPHRGRLGGGALLFSPTKKRIEFVHLEKPSTLAPRHPCRHFCAPSRPLQNPPSPFSQDASASFAARWDFDVASGPLSGGRWEWCAVQEKDTRRRARALTADGHRRPSPTPALGLVPGDRTSPGCDDGVAPAAARA